ncbi:hypothetical protein AB0F36_23055 [Streptomyces sp. NPDC029080]|uniref:hypothetical protein n=1 Tax=Streptomyces sp. NPDC029080 TaxID=3155017 RepID=UPI00340F2147
MPADEVTRGTGVESPRARTGARHAAPKKPLFTRFHMPAGKAIATVAMPTAVLVGLGFTSSLALASNGSPSPSNSQQAEDYKDCVKALGDDKDPSASPSPSASESTSESASPSSSPSPSADDKDTQGGTDGTGEQGKGSPDAKDTGGIPSSPDSGSDDKGAPEPSETPGTSGSGSDSPGDATKPAPEETGTKAGGILGTIGDTIGDILTGGHKDSGAPSATSTPTASPSSSSGTPASPAPDSPSHAPSSSEGSGSSSSGGGSVSDTVKKAGDTVEDTVKKAGDTVEDTAKKAGDTVKDTTDTVSETAGDATGSATPSPSASESASAKDCAAATDKVSGVDNKVLVADDPWYLDASSLYLKQADYQGVVEVQTASGKKKKVLKYVISGGTVIGDLHQIVKDKQTNKTYHVQAAKDSESNITGGDTVMYTESISGNLFGLLPVTFSPDSPPPLNIPYIYFTHVKVTQAAQFGGNLTIPGMHQYVEG